MARGGDKPFPEVLVQSLIASLEPDRLARLRPEGLFLAGNLAVEKRQQARWTTCVLSLGLTVAACGDSARPEPAFVTQPADAFVPVPYPPPPARVEYAPPSPRQGAVWIGGEWDFRFRRWVWTYGRWVVAPQRARYAAWRLRREANGDLSFAVGSWRDSQGRQVDAPAPLATASARENAVIEEDGTKQQVGPNHAPPPPTPPDGEPVE